MIERTVPHFGRLVFDRDAIVCAALRAHVEDALGFHGMLTMWMGDLKHGAFIKFDGCGEHVVVAWAETGAVGLAYDLGCGPIEQLGLSVEAVTGGPNDVREAVPGLPVELEPTFNLATGMLDVGRHGEKLAGAGFWLCGDRVGGTLFLFDDVTYAWGVDRLAAWGMLQGDRLPRACGGNSFEFDTDQPETRPFNTVIDAVTSRALLGPTELTPDELATLCPTPPDPKQLLHTQRMLQKVGITWPGSPEIPPE